MKHTEFTFKAFDGLQLFGQDWQPEGQPRAVVCLVHDHISVRMFIGIYQSGQWALEHASEFYLPLLLMHGGADGLTSSKASCEFADKIKENCTLKIWDGFYHEIHNEPGKEKVLKFMIDWLDKQVKT
jgi:alpha-beta hydrolase superfamily lysophospholipase